MRGLTAGQPPRKKKKFSKQESKKATAHAGLGDEIHNGVCVHAFESDPLDHAETELRAYRHVVPLLKLLAEQFGVRSKKLQIWDPYFCKGAMVKHLAQLGFTKVHNVNQDFYKVIREDRVPEHHVFMTNPPYSSDDLPRCLEFCSKLKKPCLLLLPNWVAKKPYFSELFGRMDNIFYISPLRRYNYVMPTDLVGSCKPAWVGEDGQTTPFQSSWYVILPPPLKLGNIYDRLESQMKLPNPPDCILAKSLQAAKWKLKKAQKLQKVGSSEARQKSKKPRKEKSSAKLGRKSRARLMAGTVEFD
mmetsp:Transcript_9157/g.21759  ORF Transcript_9157/g.21759 Transcript_9157/m.21759 type:complete len:302 (+) Transcript_9157:59-964(+)